MNAFTNGSHKNRWLLVAALCIAAAGCKEPTTQAQEQQTQEAGDGFILANNDGTMPEIQGIHASGAVRISLPRDQSSFPSPGPDLGAIDTTACNSCHSTGDVAEFTAAPGAAFGIGGGAVPRLSFSRLHQLTAGHDAGGVAESGG